MKYLKAVAATIASVVGVCVYAMPLSVSATTYDSCDVNRDGVVNVLDSMEIQDYLQGRERTANLSAIDVDGNSIVDYADMQCVMAKIVSLDYSCQVTGFNKKFRSGTKTSGITKSTASQKYARRKYATNTVDSYTLQAGKTPVSTLADDDTNPDGIVGPDTRTEDAMGGLVWFTFGGTGFIVGDHVIATSAHCVYDRNNSQWSNYQIQLYNNDGTPSDTFLNPVEAHMPYNFYSNSNDKYDYALVIVEEDLSDYYHYNLAMPYDLYTGGNFSKYAVYSTGFSQTIPGGTLNGTPRKMYTGVGQIVNNSYVDTNLVCYDCDITYGNSGGPVYVKEKYTVGNDTYEVNEVISICSGILMPDLITTLHNTGPMMNSMMLRFYLSNAQVNQTIQSFS